MEAESLIQSLKEIGVVALIKAVPVKDKGTETELHLLVDEHEIRKSKDLLDLD
jgi:hypothetical protein